MQFDFQLPRGTPQPRAPDRPLRLLLLGDFSGRPAGERPALPGRPTHRVDIDTLDAVMQRLAPRVPLAAGTVVLEQLDELHPDSLWQRLAVFAALRQTRQRLLDPVRYAQAAAELGAPLQANAAPAAPAAAAAPEAGGDLLAGLLGGRPAGAVAAAAKPAPAGGIDAFIRSIVAPHIVPDTAPQQAALLASVDAATAQQMRAVLHDPAWQAMEAAWRGVHWLLSSLELDERLQLHLFDVSRDELLADIVAAQGQLAQTGLHRALADRWRNQPDAEGWSLLVGLDCYGPGDTDIGLLAALGLIAAQAGGPFVAGADTALAGADATALAGWQALRGSEAAPWIGLAAPRLLLRRPYGKGSDPVESFAFEEFAAAPAHEDFLWGSGALAVALLIGRAFTARGWDFEPGDEREIDDLPAYTRDRDGEPELQAVAEHYLGEQGGEALLAAGLMPLLSHRHRNAATVMRFQSIAEPAQPLMWGSR
jgi:hypothetical protein